MNIFVQARLSESYFEQVMGDSGYKRITTFSSDLTIAEVMEGANGIENTFKRVVKEWKDDVKYFTEFVMALNIKSWECFDMKKNRTFSTIFRPLLQSTRNSIGQLQRKRLVILL